VVHEVFKELTNASTLCISRAAQIVFKPLKCTYTGTVLETGVAPFLEKCEPAISPEALTFLLIPKLSLVGKFLDLGTNPNKSRRTKLKHEGLREEKYLHWTVFQ
jgi:hypothetical protein